MPTKKTASKAKETKETKEKAVKAEGHSTAKKTVAKKKTVSAHPQEASRADKHCKVASCKRGYRAKGYCTSHYREWRHGKFGVARYKTCSDFECRKPMAKNRHGYCEDHFQNYYVKGLEVHKAPTAAPAAEPKASPPKEEKAAS